MRATPKASAISFYSCRMRRANSRARGKFSFCRAGSEADWKCGAFRACRALIAARRLFHSSKTQSGPRPPRPLLPTAAQSRSTMRGLDRVRAADRKAIHSGRYTLCRSSMAAHRAMAEFCSRVKIRGANKIWWLPSDWLLLMRMRWVR